MKENKVKFSKYDNNLQLRMRAIGLKSLESIPLRSDVKNWNLDLPCFWFPDNQDSLQMSLTDNSAPNVITLFIIFSHNLSYTIFLNISLAPFIKQSSIRLQSLSHFFNEHTHTLSLYLAFAHT